MIKYLDFFEASTRLISFSSSSNNVISGIESPTSNSGCFGVVGSEDLAEVFGFF